MTSGRVKKTAGSITYGSGDGSTDIAAPAPHQAALPPDEDIDEEATARGDIPMSLVDHLEELRRRSIVCIVVILLLAVAGFVFSDQLIAFVTEPITRHGQTLNIFKLAGGVIFRIKIAFLSALLLSLPLLLFQIWRFVMPAVSVPARRISRGSTAVSVLLFYAGIVFVFKLLLPLVLEVLLGMIGSQYVSTIGADDYLGFLLFLCIAMGLLFQFPIAVMLLTRIGIVTPYLLRSKRKYSYILLWIVAALITPQDLLSQVIVAIPLMLLYESAIIISRIVLIRQKKRELAAKTLDAR
ncbi:MAG: twin-arginine translocase subunit TatC [Spirochaetes bacterium]|nr:twin-arginine translocase subunit TatC [Spirochaetota bacterium]